MATYLQLNFAGFNGKQYQVAIRDETFEGAFIEVNGYAVLSYPEVRDPMTVIRGSELKMFIETDVNSTFQNRLIDRVGDKRFEVLLFENGVRKWGGWLKPDGIDENWVIDRWEIELQAICGLGLLQNTTFLDEDGQPYRGRIRELDLLVRCLRLTGVEINLRLYDLDMFFSIEDNDDPSYAFEAITQSYVNADRFRSQDKNNSTFNAKDVLEGILNKYGCCVYQFGNRWHVIRIVRFFNLFGINGYRDYNLNGVLVATNFIETRNKALGSNINGAYPFHCGENQRIRHASSLGGYKAVYKYGFLNNLLNNSNLVFQNFTTINDWDNFGTFNIDYTLPFTGFPTPVIYIVAQPPAANPYDLLFESTTDPDFSQNDAIRVLYSGRALHVRQIMRLRIRVKLIGMSTTTYWLNSASEWQTTSQFLTVYDNTVSPFFQSNINFTFDIQSSPLPEDGNIKIEILNGFSDGVFMDAEGGFYDNNIVLNGNVANNATAESHTATRADGAAAVVSLQETFYTGDNDTDIYIGNIENVDGENSLSWLQGNGGSILFDRKLLLEHLVIDRLIISGGNSKEFSGDIFGEFPYHGRLTIDGIDGYFMTTMYEWNMKEDITNAKHIQIFSNQDIREVIDYEFKFEDDTIVRPTVVS